MSKNKRLIVMISLTASVIGGLALYIILSGGFTWDAIIIMIIVAMFLTLAIPKYIINRNDTVGEDEYSKKVLRLAASRSYLMSLYAWLIMMYFEKALDDYFEATSTKIGLGIALMAVIFLVNIIVIKITGIKE